MNFALAANQTAAASVAMIAWNAYLQLMGKVVMKRLCKRRGIHLMGSGSCSGSGGIDTGTRLSGSFCDSM